MMSWKDQLVCVQDGASNLPRSSLDLLETPERTSRPRRLTSHGGVSG